MYDDDEFMGTGLEEKVFHVAEEDVHFAATMIDIAKAILVDFNLTGDTFSFQSGTKVDAIQSLRFAIYID